MKPSEIQSIWQRRRDYRNDIPRFAREILKITLEPAQEKAVLDFQRTGRIVVKAGHGVGKTVVLVVLLYHQLFCFNQSIVPCTAPTKHQLYDILWTEAARWMQGNRILEEFFVWTATKIAVRGYENTWYAVALPSNNPDSLAGFHARHLLYLLDEAPGIKEASFAVVEGALTNKENKVAMIGNPVKITGFFHDAFSKNASDWSGSTISCLNSHLVGPEYPKRIARMFGENSNIYRIRVLGEFPQGEDDSIIPIDLVRQAMERDDALAVGPIEGGCDVARYGDDRTEIYIRNGSKVIDHIEIMNSDLMTVSAACFRLIAKHQAKAFKIDQTGMGAGVVDRLREIAGHTGCQIVGVDNNQTAIESDKYENAGTEMYFNLKDSLQSASIPDDDEILGEISLRKYKVHRSSGRLVINNKEELRADMKRQGITPRSPDKGDALALCFYQVASQSSGIVINKNRSISEGF